MDRDSRQVILLGDPGQDCLHDKRSDSRYRLRRKLTQDASDVAQDLGLKYVEVTGWDTLREVTQSPDFDQGLFRQFRNLRRSDLVIEATDGNDAHYIIVETPFRAFGADVDRVQRNSPVIAAVTGCATHSVIACVKRDSSLDGRELPSNIHWRIVDKADLDPG